MRVIRDNTEVIARRMGFDEDQVFELAMIVDEAYANAVEHGGGAKGGSELEIAFLIFHDRLEVSVKDTGCGFDLSCVPIPKNLRSLNSTRGRGLGLISMLSDSYELSSTPGSGTILRLTKYLCVHREFVA
jgi:serine/threonine-protein kinase RsbW